ncbi:MAG: aminotransferase class IV [Oligoflexia bacterium]|nr:aminotransferase class IV [Oligoflexia bacterium]
MKPLANVNGQITPLEQASISVLDRGFQYGDSVYEVIRTYSGVPFYLDEHCERLENSAKLCHMKISQSRTELIEAIRKTAIESNLENKEDVFIRYIVTRGSGPLDLDPNTSSKTSYVIIVKAIPNWNQSFYTHGLCLYIPKTLRNSPLALSPNIKGGNYLNNILGLSEAKEAGYDDALFLSAEGYLTESSNSNVLFVKDKKVISPKTNDESHTGSLNGITKRIIQKICNDIDLPFSEDPMSLDSLDSISECFITSATREIMPVSKIGSFNKRLNVQLKPLGEITSLLQNEYKNFVSTYVKKNERNRWF